MGFYLAVVALLIAQFNNSASFLIQKDRILRASTIASLLSDAYQDGDLVAIQKPGSAPPPRLCAVRGEGGVIPLCIHADDVETDLFVDPRVFSDSFWQKDVQDSDVTATFGEGFYGQRPVPSLGGGPGYGAEADELWSVTVETLEDIRASNVDLPMLDMGIAHGEKARGGFF